MKKLFLFFLLCSLFISCSNKPARVMLKTDKGDIVVRLYDETPIHRDNFLKLAETGALNGTLFHRVIAEFMIQGGDPDSKGATPGMLLGEGEVGEQLPAEIRADIHHKRGSLAAAREGDYTNPEHKSSGSQFYIVWDNASHLDGAYTVFGEVESGLDVVDVIRNVATDENDRPLEDVVLIEMEIL